MNRRQFIQSGIYGTASVLWMPRFLSSCKKEDDLLSKDIDWDGTVIVVGAGAAGMYAAHLLDRLGVNVEVLEASPVHGGRVKTLTGFSDFPVELGAEWVEGQQSRWHDIAKSHSSFVDDNSTDYGALDGVLKSESQLEGDNDVQAAISLIDNIWRYDGADISVEQYISDQGISPRVHHILEAYIGTEYGSSNSRIGMKTLALEDNKWTAGNTSFLLKGNSIQSVFESEFSNIIDRIKLNTPVTSIDYSGNMIELRDTGGTLHTADRVIVTVPVTVLKSGDIQFIPELPDAKNQAALGIAMDAGMKIIMKFSQRFWPGNASGIISAGNVKVFTATGYGRSAENNLLTAFIMGSDAEHMSARGTAAVSVAVQELDDLFGSNAASAVLVDSHIQDWSKEPFIRGAYSYPNPGSEPLRATLAQSIDKKLYFAGEATHAQGHFATVHGAMETAYRAVDELTDDL